MRILPWLIPALLLTPAAAQSLRTVTNKKHGFKVKVPRFVKETPTAPDEDQIIAKFKGTQVVKAPKGYFYTDPKTGKRLKSRPEELEIWVIRIKDPKKEEPADKGPVTRSGFKTKTRRDAGDADEAAGARAKRHKNSGRTIKEFLDRRMVGVSARMSESPETSPWRDRDKNKYRILKLEGDPSQVQSFTIEHRVPHFGHELFGMVWRSRRMDAFQKFVAPCVKSLRRNIRSRLVKGWYAEDTENFILVTDMTNNSSNRQLLKDMLIDLEIMRNEYEKRFPPVEEFDVVCTVRVCNSYDGYIRYSAKPGTGGYWHPIAEELVLFNPVGKIKKQAWMKRVTPKAILYHEAMHQYFHYSNGEMPPASWFNEGYGEYFGGAKTDRYEKKIFTIGKNDFRWQVIKKAKKAKKWPLIKKMLPMTQQVFYSRKSKDYPVLNNYAFAWAFCYFLELERKKRGGNKEWAAIPDNYLKNLRKATRETVGKLGNQPKGSMFRFAIAVQKRAHEWTFKDTDFDKLQADWVAAMKSW